MIQRIQRLLLFLVLFFTISQFGKHFWPDFAYVSGIRVDYLSPTLYLTDVFIIVLFVTALPSLVKYFKEKKHKFSPWLVVALLSLIISTLLASHIFPAFYGLVKVLEFVFLTIMVRKLINPHDFKVISIILSFAVLLEGSLVLWQFIKQSSVGGAWYLLGERSFTSGTVGISTATILGKEYLRAYGSFPHPNVLAFFMLIASLFLLVSTQKLSGSILKFWFWLMFVYSVTSLVLTFSRLPILLFFLSILGLSYKSLVTKRMALIIALSALLLVGLLFQRFSISALSYDLNARISLSEIGIKILSENLFYGVGLLNYFYYQLSYQREITHLLLQPIHNIYLLVLVQLGLLGFIPLIKICYVSLKRIIGILTTSKNKFKIVSALLALSLLIIGLADHYFITLQQGVLMTAFIFGWLWTDSERKATR